MIRTSRRVRSGPVYREVLRHALQTAWRERRFWPLALGSSLLMSGGVYDVIWKASTNITDQGVLLNTATDQARATGTAIVSALSGTASLIGVASGIQAVLVASILLIALAALSCICQGALVYALGAIHRGNQPSVREALRIGGNAFWPTAALNALTLTTVWILRFLIALALSLALGVTNGANWFLYFVSFVVFLTLVFAMSIIQIFALNAMILQGAPINDALLRGYVMLKKHWVVALETTVMLMFVAMCVGVVFVCIYFLLLLPLIAAVVAAGVVQSPGLLFGAMGVGLAVFILGTLAVTSFITQLQYAAWTSLYRKLGEGGILPKLHRWIRDVTGFKSIPN